jgi:hypothetical protein
MAAPASALAIVAAGCGFLDAYDFNGYTLDAGAEASCAGTASDRHNCGSCGHDCLGGDCADGVCKAFVIAQAAYPFSVAVRGGAVYWTSTLQSGAVYRANVDGGGRTPLAASTWPFTVMTDSTYAYWTAGYDGGSLQRCFLGGCNDDPEVVYRGSDYPYGVASGDTATYWTLNPWDGLGALPDAGGAIWIEHQGRADAGGTQLIGDQAYPYGITTVGDSLYWADDGPGAADQGVIMRANLDGTGAKPIATGQAYPTNVIAYAGRLYWTNLGLAKADGSVMTCAPSNCVSPIAIATEQHGPFGLGVDATGVYWTNSSGSTVAWCPLAEANCKAPVLATGQDSPYGLALDGVSIYWTNYSEKGSVMRLAK